MRSGPACTFPECPLDNGEGIVRYPFDPLPPTPIDVPDPISLPGDDTGITTSPSGGGSRDRRIDRLDAGSGRGEGGGGSTSGLPRFIPYGTVLLDAESNVRRTPMGEVIGSQDAGAVGRILQGPVEKGGRTWYEIEYENGMRGWTSERNLSNPGTVVESTDVRVFSVPTHEVDTNPERRMFALSHDMRADALPPLGSEMARSFVDAADTAYLSSHSAIVEIDSPEGSYALFSRIGDDGRVYVGGTDPTGTNLDMHFERSADGTVVMSFTLTKEGSPDERGAIIIRNSDDVLNLQVELVRIDEFGNVTATPIGNPFLSDNPFERQMLEILTSTKYPPEAKDVDAIPDFKNETKPSQDNTVQQSPNGYADPGELDNNSGIYPTADASPNDPPQSGGGFLSAIGDVLGSAVDTVLGWLGLGGTTPYSTSESGVWIKEGDGDERAIEKVTEEDENQRRIEHDREEIGNMERIEGPDDLEEQMWVSENDSDIEKVTAEEENDRRIEDANSEIENQERIERDRDEADRTEGADLHMTGGMTKPDDPPEEGDAVGPGHVGINGLDDPWEDGNPGPGGVNPPDGGSDQSTDYGDLNTQDPPTTDSFFDFVGDIIDTFGDVVGDFFGGWGGSNGGGSGGGVGTEEPDINFVESY